MNQVEIFKREVIKFHGYEKIPNDEKTYKLPDGQEISYRPDIRNCINILFDPTRTYIFDNS